MSAPVVDFMQHRLALAIEAEVMSLVAQINTGVDRWTSDYVRRRLNGATAEEADFLATFGKVPATADPVGMEWVWRGPIGLEDS